FVYTRGAVVGAVGIDGGDRNGPRGRGEIGGATAATDRGEARHLVDGAPRAAFQAAPHPLGGEVLALRAAILRARVSHVTTVSGSGDNPGATGGRIVGSDPLGSQAGRNRHLHAG